MLPLPARRSTGNIALAEHYAGCDGAVLTDEADMTQCLAAVGIPACLRAAPDGTPEGTAPLAGHAEKRSTIDTDLAAQRYWVRRAFHVKQTHLDDADTRPASFSVNRLALHAGRERAPGADRLLHITVFHGKHCADRGQGLRGHSPLSTTRDGAHRARGRQSGDARTRSTVAAGQ